LPNRKYRKERGFELMTVGGEDAILRKIACRKQGKLARKMSGNLGHTELEESCQKCLRREVREDSGDGLLARRDGEIMSRCKAM
jgi:hypothetical protein